MKLSLTTLSACASLVTAADLQGNLEARSHGKCHYSNKVCCNYQDGYDGNHYYPSPHSGYGRTIHVNKKSKGIQHAIESASSGDTIVVEAGTYAEQLTIDRDGIQLIGQNAILVPPTKPVQNTCSGLTGPNSQAGVCITGHGVKLAAFIAEHRTVTSVKKTIDNVSVTGFTVQGFSGLNIAVVGARNAHITKNTLKDGGSYGALTVGSYDTIFEANQVSTSKNIGFIGICMDNKSGVEITKNTVSSQFIGLCVQTNKAKIHHNIIKDSCFGMFVDPAVDGVVIAHNDILGTNGICATIGDGGTNSGIVLDGATNARVLDNLVDGQKIGGKGAGISVVDDACTGDNPGLTCVLLGHAAVSSGNVILRNTLRNNDYDIYVNTKGKKNVVACNECSKPDQYCKH